MLKLVLVTMLAFSVLANKYIEGEGKFLSSEDDSVAFIKNQLLTNAFNKVIDSELNAMGLDAKVFWKNYDEKFLESFKTIEESIEQKFLVPEGQTLKKEQIEQKEKELREKRLTAKSKFGRLRKAIKSYSIVKMSKSLRLVNSHFININAQVDRKYLADVYYNFMGVSTVRNLQKLLIETKYQLINTNWLELGVDTESDFTNVVNNHWKKNIEEKISNVFENGVELASDSDKKNIQDHLKNSKEVLSAKMDNALADTLLLSFEINVKKVNLDNELKKITLYFSGGITLTDLKTNSVISFYDFPSEKQSFEMMDQHKLNSDIASLVYRLPAIYFSDFRKIVEDKSKVNDQFDIFLRKTNNAKEALTFADRLREKGLLFYFNTNIKNISKDEIHLQISYSGEREKAMAVLGKMVSEKVSENRIISKDNSLPFVFNVDTIEGAGTNESNNSGI